MIALARFVSGLLLLSLPAGLLAQAQATDTVPDTAVISQSTDLSLTAEDYRLLFAGPPLAELERMTQSDHNLRETALDFHSSVVLAREAEAQGLADDPQVKARLERARRAVLVDAMVARTRARAAAQVPEDLLPLAHERYLSDRQAFYIPEQRLIAHILLTDTTDCACKAQVPALERAQELRLTLVDGADFAQAAREYSADPGTAGRGGEFGEWITRDGKLYKSFEDAAFALDTPGAISEPVVTPYGVHLIKLLDVQEARIPEFDEVSDRIIARLKAEIVGSSVQQLQSQAYPDPNTIDLETLRKVAAQSLQDRGVQVQTER